VGRGRLNRVAAVAATTFRESVRERVFYNLLAFALLMTLSGLLLARLSIRQHEKIIKDVGLASIDVFGVAIALFLGVQLVSKEIERRSLFPVLAKPLSRDEFLLGRFVGLALTLAVNVAAMTAGLALTLAATGAKPTLSILAAVYPLYLSHLLVVGLALLLSSLTGPTVAALGTLCLTVAGRLSDVVRNARSVLPDAPAFLVDAVYYLLPNFRNFDFKDRIAYGDAVGLQALLWVTLYAAAYLGAVLSAALLVFRRREFQ
jgi:ABC-type transport system involved in multi-copper enzyme maturation permease subunit